MLKRELLRILTAVPLAAVAAAALLWQRGYYDVSFIPRTQAAETETTDTTPPTTDGGADSTGTPPAEVPSAESPSAEDPSAEAPSAEDPSAEDPSAEPETSGETAASKTIRVGDSLAAVMSRKKTTAEGFSPASDADLRAKGYYFTDTVYDGGTHAVAKVAPPFKLTSVFSYRKGTEYAVEVIKPDDSEWYGVYVPTEIDEPAMKMYMGYIIYDYKGESCYLLDSQGNTLLRFDPQVYKPAYTRDSANNPLFYTETEVIKQDENGREYTATIRNYYKLTADRTAFEPAVYDDAAENRGVYCDYPSYYGVSDSKYLKFCYSNTVVTTYKNGAIVERPACKFAYGTSNKSLKTQYRFAYAYNFSEGLAAVGDADRSMSFISESGYTALSNSRTYKNAEGRYVISSWLLPDTSGEESLGYFYFDHGLVRVRERIIDYYNKTARNKTLVVTDESYLIRRDGSKFPIPEGYKLVAYSDGVALLEKDGKYGYYDCTGDWIAQPIYTVAEPFYCGLAVLGWKNNVGMIDTTGKVVIPLTHEYVSNSSSGAIAAYDGGWSLYNVYRK